MSDSVSTGNVPRELVLASAGSGKTYRLSSRVIGLLAGGAPPGEILASTFTRKAAAEILHRILVRLAEGALDSERAVELGRDAHPCLTQPAECRRLLSVLLRDLHQMNVSTLDSFLIRVARSFSQELGLAPGWTITDKPTEARLRTEAVQATLAETNRSEMVELLRMLHRGDAKRQVHDSLLDKIDELLRLRRQLDPAAVDPWTPDFGAIEELSDAAVAQRAGELADRLREQTVPLTKDGRPRSAWVKARDEGADSLTQLAWAAVFGKGIGAKVVRGEQVFDRNPIEAALSDIFMEARALARSDLAPKLQRETKALGRLAELLENAFQDAQRRAGAYRFEDITHLLGDPVDGKDPAGGREDLYYRLDQQVRHLLLDEFQDTSLEQWRALEPLAHELLSGHMDERAGVIVADTKQSIYGWRGARPELVRLVGKAHSLPESTMTTSWRSSHVVLSFVDSVFRELASNPVIAEIDVGPSVAAEWMRDFTELQAARDLPGHVQVHLGPEDTARGAIRPNLLRRAAEIVRDLREKIPGRTIGVLVRTNSVIGRLMDELAELGVRASGEGGASLTDTAPVNAILSLIRLADHPGDSASRYHVAKTPLGAVVGFTDRADTGQARSLAAGVRQRLLTDGYGPTLAGWVRKLASKCDAPEVQRLLQLVELGHRWDERPTLRPADFTRYVADESVEDPSSALVKVMTVHRSKGLEFDAVVLPELYASLSPKGRGVAIPERGASGRVLQVFPVLSNDLRPLFPEVEAPRADMRAAEMRDALSVLYVALTRAKYALHLVLPPEGGSAKHGAQVVRAALHLADQDVSDAGILQEWGDPRWMDRLEAKTVESSGKLGEGKPTDASPPTAGIPIASRAVSGTPATIPPLLRPNSGGPGRNLARRSPSSLEGGTGVDLEFALRLHHAPALRLGTVAHAWCERIEWIADGLPPDDTLIAVAHSVAPGMPADEVTDLITMFRAWMESDAIRTAMSRDAYDSAPEVVVQVENEFPFAHRVSGEIQEGSIDRLVLVRRDARVVAAEVLDFKTDRLQADDEAALTDRSEHYRPQIEAYCHVVREQYGLVGTEVTGKLLFLRAGVVRTVV